MTDASHKLETAIRGLIDQLSSWRVNTAFVFFTCQLIYLGRPFCGSGNLKEPPPFQVSMPDKKPSLFPIEERVAAFAETVLRRPSLTPTTYTSVNYLRLFCFLGVFLVPYALSIASLIAADIYISTGDRQTQLNGAAFDFTFGLWSFSYKMVDPGPDPPIGFVLGQDTRVKYSDYCHQIWYSTRTQSQFIIDPETFCSKWWSSAQILQILAIIAGAAALFFILDNFLVWKGWSWYFKPRFYTNDQVRIVRRTFKFFISMAVLAHMILEAIVVVLLAVPLFYSWFKWPFIQIHTGVFLGAATVGADLLFILLFTFIDKITFFHSPLRGPVV
ncbi:hypothetical protein EDD86DRAFT_269098 [Gorgonomyces haynaldii]|nr:hypothetical protein EDD86DRAFT_269098 [Gorgonomyces haynaldii]